MKATREDFMKATQNVLTSADTLGLIVKCPEFLEPAVDFSIIIANRLVDREFDSHDYAEVVDFLAGQIKPDHPNVGSYMMYLGIVTFGLRLYDSLRDVLISKEGQNYLTCPGISANIV